MWYQQTLRLGAKPRGFHLVTDEVLEQIPSLNRIKTGLLHLLLRCLAYRCCYRCRTAAYIWGHGRVSG